MSEMIERIAVEFMRKSLEGCEAEFIRACEPSICRCRFFARAAIEAMREPSNEMTVVGWKEAEKRDAILGNGEIALIFRAMIDAALASPPTELREE